MVNLGREILKDVEKPKGKIPLHREKWFRDMADRHAKGIYLGQYVKSEICNHLGGCNHRESFHVYDIPAGGDHVRKSEVWEFISWNGKIQPLGRFS